MLLKEHNNIYFCKNNFKSDVKSKALGSNREI